MLADFGLAVRFEPGKPPGDTHGQVRSLDSGVRSRHRTVAPALSQSDCGAAWELRAPGFLSHQRGNQVLEVGEASSDQAAEQSRIPIWALATTPVFQSFSVLIIYFSKIHFMCVRVYVYMCVHACVRACMFYLGVSFGEV